jgi:hypothetical protein
LQGAFKFYFNARNFKKFQKSAAVAVFDIFKKHLSKLYIRFRAGAGAVAGLLLGLQRRNTD